MVLSHVSPGDPHAGAHNAERDELNAHETKLNQHDTELKALAEKVVGEEYTPATVLRTNLAPQPVPVSAGGWVASDVTHIGSRDTVVVRRPGTTSAKIVRGADNPNSIVARWNYVGQVKSLVAEGVRIDAATNVSVSVWARSSITGRARMTVNYYDAADSVLSSANGDYTDMTPDAWTRVEYTTTPPTGATHLQVIVSVAMPTGQTVTGGESAWAQDALIEQGSSGDYFDGHTPDADGIEYEWAGTANASVSQAWQPAAGEPPILEWALADAYDVTSVTATDTSTGLATSAAVLWPDTSSGAFAGTVNTEFGAYDAYQITHTNSGLQVSQAPVTRGPDGTVTSKPALTVGVS